MASSDSFKVAAKEFHSTSAATPVTASRVARTLRWRFRMGCGCWGARARPRVVRAHAFGPISLDPPIVLWTIERDDLRDMRLGVGTLPCEHSFGGPAKGALTDESSSQNVHWMYGCAFGAPYIENAAAHFEAVVVREIVFERVSLFFGQVGDFSANDRVSGALSYAQKACTPEFLID